MIKTNKHQRIIILKVENGFQVSLEDDSSMKSSIIFVYNDYRDLVRDMNNFLEVEEYKEEEEEERDESD